MKSPRQLAAETKHMSEVVASLMQQGKVDEAIKLYPEHEPEIRFLEKVHASLGNQTPETTLQRVTGQKSMQELKRLVDEANAAHREALMLSRIGDFEGAEKAFNRAIAATPEFAQAYMNRAILYVQTDRPGQATADFEAAVRLAPQSDMAKRMLADAKAGNWKVFKV